MVLDIARLFFLPALMAFAAVSDLLTMTISNRVSLLLVAGFAVLAASSGMTVNDLLQHGAAGLIVLVVSFACFAMGWIGGGDAKVASAAALWFGLPYLLQYLLCASLFGGALTLLLLQFRQWPLPYALGKQDWLLRLHGRDADIPYGVALALGALAIYPDTPWIQVVDLTRFAMS
ncbi:prepilin peptidase [Bradyrhizobium prioriisuperbiae]|uniref:A24 family peptidase n=1 Tax=Bradyrhizobium prioriisuperbiae TaxID=2854389 RepID=UPI0028E50F8B|nr:prepilin peptidase [Bradyrhizobium prioritasuperba]